MNRFLTEAYYKDNNVELAKKQYLRTKGIYKRINMNVPQSKTWTEMKEKFEN
jgi:hypothetical protein